MQTPPRQKIMLEIGNNGCFFLDLVNIAERHLCKQLDAVKIYLDAVNKGYMESNCYVALPFKLMEMMTGVAWIVKAKSKDYKPLPNEYSILRYEQGNVVHFIMPDYDPMGKAISVYEMNWTLISKHVLWPA